MCLSVFLSSPTNWEFGGRADSQAVTALVCNRLFPDPLGIVYGERLDAGRGKGSPV